MFGMISISIKNIVSDFTGRALAIIAGLFFFSACNSNSGGPCDWDILRVEAQVTDIFSYAVNENGDSLYHVALNFDGSSYSEKTQYMDELRNMEFTKDVVEKNRVRVGAIYKATVSEIKTGDCKSPVLSFDAKIKP